MYRIALLLVSAGLLSVAAGIFSGCSSSSETTFRSRAGENPPESNLNLQELIDNTPDGGTVRIPKAKYILTDGLRVYNRNNLTIACERGSQILVNDISADVLEIADSKGIRLQGAFLRHLKPLPKYECHGDVLKLRTSEDVIVEDSELDGCGAIGVSIWKSTNVTVQHCLIQNNSFNALYFESGQNIRVHNCVIQDNANFMQLYRTQDVQMSGNIVRRNGGYWEEPQKPGLREE